MPLAGGVLMVSRAGARVSSSASAEDGSWHGGVGWASRVGVPEIQRSRLLAAAVGVIDEVGYSDATIVHITSRARVSRRTFYELFEDRDDCLSAVLESALGMVEARIAAASLDGLAWRDRVCSGLWAILSFFDRDQVLARVCVVQSSRGDERVLERRALVLARLASTIDEGRREGSRGVDPPRLTAEGLVGAVHGIVYERLLSGSREPLTGLLGPLMAMIVLPYLGSAAARREQQRSVPELPSGFSARDLGGPLSVRDPLAGIPMRVTYRTARVLQCVAERPGISNRLIGEGAGVPDQGQISKLLARLERFGLMANRDEGYVKGEANAWRLTPAGYSVVHALAVSAKDRERFA